MVFFFFYYSLLSLSLSEKNVRVHNDLKALITMKFSNYVNLFGLKFPVSNFYKRVCVYECTEGLLCQFHVNLTFFYIADHKENTNPKNLSNILIKIAKYY